MLIHYGHFCAKFYEQLHNNNILANDLLLLTDVYMVSIDFYKYTLCLHSQTQTFVSSNQGRNCADRLKRGNDTLKEEVSILHLIYIYSLKKTLPYRKNTIEMGSL